jgi:hypothetical protein
MWNGSPLSLACPQSSSTNLAEFNAVEPLPKFVPTESRVFSG